MSLWQRCWRHPQRVWLRRALFQVHLWTGIGLGLYVVILSITGSALVYRTELDLYFRTPRPQFVRDARRVPTEEIRANAQQEAASIVREAEGKAQTLMLLTQTRIEEAQREVDAMKMKRRDAETQIEATISALQHTLEFVREQDQRDRAEKVVVHRPRLEAAS